MAPNPVELLLDMAAVHAFYVILLQDALGHPVPVPHDVQANRDQVGRSVENLTRWLNLLDLAITPPMVRDGLKESTSRETAEALLRYFVRKASPKDADRDKADFVTTFLYRQIVPPEQQLKSEMSVDAPSEFEEEVYTILGDHEVQQLPEEHRQLVREFPFIRQEVEDFRHFDQLMDSGVMQRVREIKQRFAASFYNPRVLATIAEYNVFFGVRFDELFRDTARQLKEFASQVQQQGGSIMSRVDGDVTVKHLTDVEENKIMETEYGRAQEQFRKISKFKKAVDTRSAGRPAPAAAPVPPRPAATSRPAKAPHVPTEHLPMRGMDVTLEESKLRSMQDSVRNFVLAADPKSANVVPLKNGNLVLTAAEVEIFRAEYLGEKSFRGDFASAVCLVVAIQACMSMELREFTAKRNSAYLWKPHADSLTFLVSRAQRAQEQCGAVIDTAQKRGLGEKVNAMNASLQKMRVQVQLVAQALEKVGT